MVEHPLRFSKRYLLRTRWCSIRLHVWRRPGRETPHAHRWAFVSVPIWGRFVDVRWTKIPGDGYRLVHAYPDRGRRRRYVVQDETSSLLGVEYTRWPLLPYRCAYGEIHSFSPRRRGVTLVFLGRERSDYSDMWEAR